MPSWIIEQRFEVALGALFVIVFCRAQATYWLGRAAAAGVGRTRLSARFTGPKLSRARSLLERWGLPLVTVSFLTVGLQTAVNATAGLLAIAWPRYTLAMIPGCVAWAGIYLTVGFAAIEAWARLAAHSPWAPWLVALALVCVGVLWWRLLRSRRPEPSAEVE